MEHTDRATKAAWAALLIGALFLPVLVGYTSNLPKTEILGGL